ILSNIRWINRWRPDPVGTNNRTKHQTYFRKAHTRWESLVNSPPDVGIPESRAACGDSWPNLCVSTVSGDCSGSTLWYGGRIAVASRSAMSTLFPGNFEMVALIGEADTSLARDSSRLLAS